MTGNFTFTTSTLLNGAIIAATVYTVAYLLAFGFHQLKKYLWKAAAEDYRQELLQENNEPLLLTCPCGQEVPCAIKPSATADNLTPLKLLGECPACGKHVDAPFLPLPDLHPRTYAFIASFAILGVAALKLPALPSIIFTAGSYALVVTWMKRRTEKQYLTGLWKTPEENKNRAVATKGEI